MRYIHILIKLISYYVKYEFKYTYRILRDRSK